jgi:predicted nucleotidyltransferase
MAASPILSALMPRTRQVVLRELVAGSGDFLHVRELERRTGAYSGNVGRELRKLEAAGIVESKRVGRQVLYRMDARCPVYPELRMLVVKTVGLADELRRALAPLSSKIRFAYVYGSFATGGAGVTSDVDLMVVGGASLYDVSEALDDAERTLRREINPTVYSMREYKAELAEGEGFVYGVHNGPKLMLIGGADEVE